MPGFFNTYPYTNFHELNLDWLLEKYKGLVDDVATINAWVAQHKIEYEEAIAELQRVANEVDTFEAHVNARFEALKSEQEQELQNAINSLNNQIDSKINQLRNELEIAIQDMHEYYDQFQVYMQNEFTIFKGQINREIASMRGLITANNDYIFSWVENKWEEFINSLPEIITVQVYNPYRGEVTGIQQAIFDIYSVACVLGLTADEYDYIGLTASQYDAYELTAVQYDTQGKDYLQFYPLAYMVSPFTGQPTLVRDVVLRLAYFHMEGLTASEYDAKELTASEYDALAITAFDYDWFGEQLIA